MQRSTWRELRGWGYTLIAIVALGAVSWAWIQHTELKPCTGPLMGVVMMVVTIAVLFARYVIVVNRPPEVSDDEDELLHSELARAALANWHESRKQVSQEASMSPEGIARIEEALEIRVPPDYRELMLAYPAVLVELGIADFELLCEPEQVIAENRSIRVSRRFDTTWPDAYFLIGEDGCGDFYCLDLSRLNSPVILFDHECQAQFVELADSLEAWLPLMVAESVLDDD
jgi:hypothetical protein